MRALLLSTVLFVACASSQKAPESSPKPPPASPSASHGPLVHRFEHAEQWASVFDDPARDAWQKPQLVVDTMKIAPGATVADLGTGTGYFLPYLSKAVGSSGKVLALDVEPDMIRYVKERTQKSGWTNVEARVVPLDDPGLAEASVDRVLIVDTWHHVPERKTYAAKLARALRPGGAVFIVDFTMEAKEGPPKHHRLLPEAVIDELAAGGLKSERVPADLPEQWIVAGRKP